MRTNNNVIDLLKARHPDIVLYVVESWLTLHISTVYIFDNRFLHSILVIQPSLTFTTLDSDLLQSDHQTVTHLQHFNCTG